jgi:hypothetical protein
VESRSADASARFAGSHPWNTLLVREVLIVSAIVSLMGVVVWIGLLLWAAREDGRDQQRRDRQSPRPR